MCSGRSGISPSAVLRDIPAGAGASEPRGEAGPSRRPVGLAPLAHVTTVTSCGQSAGSRGQVVGCSRERPAVGPRVACICVHTRAKSPEVGARVWGTGGAVVRVGTRVSCAGRDPGCRPRASGPRAHGCSHVHAVTGFPGTGRGPRRTSSFSHWASIYRAPAVCRAWSRC